jgi:hypothetical protein
MASGTPRTGRRQDGSDSSAQGGNGGFSSPFAASTGAAGLMVPERSAPVADPLAKARASARLTLLNALLNSDVYMSQIFCCSPDFMDVVAIEEVPREHYLRRLLAVCGAIMSARKLVEEKKLCRENNLEEALDSLTVAGNSRSFPSFHLAPKEQVEPRCVTHDCFPPFALTARRGLSPGARTQ